MKSNKVNKIDINPNKINEMVNDIKPIKNGAYKAVIFLFSSSIYTEGTKTKFTSSKQLLNRVKDVNWCVMSDFEVCFFLLYVLLYYLWILFVFVRKSIDRR